MACNVAETLCQTELDTEQSYRAELQSRATEQSHRVERESRVTE